MPRWGWVSADLLLTESQAGGRKPFRVPGSRPPRGTASAVSSRPPRVRRAGVQVLREPLSVSLCLVLFVLPESAACWPPGGPASHRPRAWPEAGGFSEGHHQRRPLNRLAGVRAIFFFFLSKFGSTFGGFMTPTPQPTFPDSLREHSGRGVKPLGNGWDVSHRGGHPRSGFLPSPQSFWNVGGV